MNTADFIYNGNDLREIENTLVHISETEIFKKQRLHIFEIEGKSNFEKIIEDIIKSTDWDISLYDEFNAYLHIETGVNLKFRRPL